MINGPRTGLAFLAGLVCLLAGQVPSWAAVADYVGRPIGSVSLAIEDRVTDDPSLAHLVETAVGQPLSMAAVRETVSRLFGLGRFEGVRVDATLANGRVALRYELSPIHSVTRIQFAESTGARGIDTGALRRAIIDRYGATPPQSRSTDNARLVESALAERGYRHATATPSSQIEHDHATLTLTIQPNTTELLPDGEDLLPDTLAKLASVVCADQYRSSVDTVIVDGRVLKRAAP